MPQYKALLAIGVLRIDPDNKHRRIVDFKHGRVMKKWYKAPTIMEAYTFANKTRFSKLLSMYEISFDDYIKGVSKQHEY